MTGDEGKSAEPDSFYIPPTAGPAPAGAAKTEKAGEDWAGLLAVIAGLVILIAGFQLFMIILQLINTWVADELVPVFTAGFDILVIAGGVWLIQTHLRKK